MGGTLFQPQPQLTLLDAQGNVVPSTGATATATLVAGPAGFAASDLIGPATASFVGGYAQFSGLKINKWVLTVGTRGGGASVSASVCVQGSSQFPSRDCLMFVVLVCVCVGERGRMCRDPMLCMN